MTSAKRGYTKPFHQFDQNKRCGEEQRFLRWLAFSANSISFLPVVLAPISRDCDRTFNAEILTPQYLNEPLTTVTFSQTAECKEEKMPSPVQDAYEVEAKTDAFGATLLWEKIVMHLERSVKSRRRSQRLRTFEDCFPGSKAVECLTDYLNTILPKTIKRSQVRTLCQKLLLTGVIEDVKNKEKSVFQEGRLYRFTGFHFWETPGGTLSPNEKVRTDCLFASDTLVKLLGSSQNVNSQNVNSLILRSYIPCLSARTFHGQNTSFYSLCPSIPF